MTDNTKEMLVSHVVLVICMRYIRIIALQDGSEVPVFKQIRNQIVMGISDGRLQPGEKLSAVRALADEIGINSMTVNKAYQLLKQEGDIVTDRRNGVCGGENFAQAQGFLRGLHFCSGRLQSGWTE